MQDCLLLTSPVIESKPRRADTPPRRGILSVFQRTSCTPVIESAII